jgi:predicted  nucleic acid-binding Zn-ribbon protein
MSQDISTEEKLRALYDLQLIHSRIDQLRSIRGELPLEVQDLEDEIAGLQTRLAKTQAELEEIENEISNKNNLIAECREKITKYEDQQKNVRNNREFDALSKEIEFQQLEIQLAEKRIREFRARIEGKNEAIAGLNERIEERTSHLGFKKSELDGILAETQKEENWLEEKALDFEKKIDDRLLAAYKRIRDRAKNGLAVVPIERGASAGSFFTIPPQRQMEVATRKRIITDEHSGRFLVDAELASEEEAKINELIANSL